MRNPTQSSVTSWMFFEILLSIQVSMRRYTRRPPSTALTIPPSPGRVSTIFADAFATSVAFETATPTSACRSAGASLTPSPVIPTIRRRSWRARTSVNLSSGYIPANPANSSEARERSSRLPTGPSSPSERPTARAVVIPSPVTMTTRMPNS